MASRCLLCGELPPDSGPPFLHIYSEFGKQLNLAEKINNYLSIEILADLPQQVCCPCQAKFIGAHHLLTETPQPNMKIKEKIHSGQETEILEDVDLQITDSSSCTMDMGVQDSVDFENMEDSIPAKKLKLDSHSALHEAINSKDWDIVRHLLDSGEKPCNTDGIENCFVLITKLGNCELLQRVLASQPSAIHCRGPNDEGLTLLMYAQNIDTLKTLFKFGPDVNARNTAYEENVLIRLIRSNVIVDNLTPEFDMFFEMAHYIIDQGIDVNAMDDLPDKTALQLVLKLDATSYADRPYQVDQLIEKLLKCQPNISQFDVDAHERVLKFARIGGREPQIFHYIIDLLEHGLDPTIRDFHGNNLMYNVIHSHYKNIRSTYGQKIWAYSIEKISDQCLALLRHGCELGGLLEHICVRNHPFFLKVGGYRVVRKVAKEVNLLSLLMYYIPGCDFTEELFMNSNLKLKKRKKCISELTYLLLNYNKWLAYDFYYFEILDKAVTFMLDCGVNVMQQRPGSLKLLNKNAEELEKKILATLPDSLWLAGQNVLKMAGEDDEEMESYQISCKILVALLRFWPYPPLILFIFLYNDHLEPSSVMALLKFLTRVGGRLPQGSPLFKCLKKRLLAYSKRDPDVRALPQLFTKMHAEIPSLKELCRPVVRASLSKITTSGLDLSSLRVLCQGEMREVPTEIQDYLNFKDQPLFCEDDFYE